VTDQLFQAFGHRYPIADLTDVVWGVGSTQNARRLTIRLVAVEALIVTMIMVVVPTVAAVAAALAYLMFAVALIRYAIWRWPTPLELWADYRGEPVKLFASSNHAEFNQVRRALMRALELHESQYIG
jgi:hypothetical protein